MRLTKFITTVLFIITYSVYAQKEYATEYEAQYEVTYSIDSADLNNKSTETLYLFTGSEYGVFMSYGEAFKEEIMANLQHQLKTTGAINITKEMNSNFPKSFYKNHQDASVRTHEKIDRKQYNYQEPSLPLVWKMEDDSKEVMGYTTQKASTHFAGRDYIAWFTLEIPIPDGPYLFFGLPGFIIELYDAENHYHFILKTLTKLEESRVFEFPKSEEIVKENFLELKEKVLKNAEHNTLDVGNIQMKVVSTSEMSQESKMKNQEMKRKIKENRAKKNNLIERF